jgi:uncharacterized membrane protein YhaH (DUF805 family)
MSLFFDLRGRLSRADYVRAALPLWAAVVAALASLVIVDSRVFDVLVAAAAVVLGLWCWLAITMKRLRDAALPPALAGLVVLPGVGIGLVTSVALLFPTSADGVVRSPRLF